MLLEEFFGIHAEALCRRNVIRRQRDIGMFAAGVETGDPFVALEADHAVFGQQCRYGRAGELLGMSVCRRSWGGSSGGYTPHSAGHDITVNHGRFSQGSGIIRFSDFPAEKRLVTAIACSEPAGAKKPGASRRPVICIVRLSSNYHLNSLDLSTRSLMGALEAGPGLGGTVVHRVHEALQFSSSTKFLSMR